MSEITISTGHPDAGRIYAEALDRVTAERDAALGREVALKETLERWLDLDKARDARCDALQALLTAADVLLREAAKDDDGEYSLGSDWHDRYRAALKPAERTNTSGNAHCPNDGICHASDETCAEALVRIASLKPAEGGGDEYRKSCEVAHKALSMENQRIVAPGQFKCLACGDVHPGSGNLPCPKMSPTA